MARFDTPARLLAALALACAACTAHVVNGSGDAGSMDAGPTDAGPTDAGSMDAGPTDAGPTADAGPGDAGARCPGFAPPPQSGGTTLYVAPSGDDANPGTQDAPFATIQHAADVTNPGDTVIVEDGTYTTSTAGAPIVTLSRSGTASAWIWFRAEHRWGAKLDGQNNTHPTGFKFASGAGFIRVEGFEIFGTGADGSGDAFEVYSGGHDVQIVANHVHDIGRLCTDTSNGEVGIFVQQPNVTIEANLFHDIGRFAPGESGCTPSNAYYENHDHGIYVDGNADSAAPGASSVTIKNNIFYNVGRGWAVQLYPGTLSGIEILNNTFATPNPYRDGQIIIYSTTLSDSEIANNIFFEPTNSAIELGTTAFQNATITANLTTAPAMLDATAPSGLTVSGNVLGVDPLFVDAGARDFHLTSASPARDAGAPLSEVPVDFDGCLRSASGSDLGAYQYSP